MSVLIAALLLAGCEGDTGLQGPPGTAGELPDPDDRYFSLAVTDDSGGNHNGIATAYLDFDGDSGTAGAVVANKISSPPLIDGSDSEWSDADSPASTLILTRQAGTDNGIYAADVRAAYDDHYVYFSVKWTEATKSQEESAEKDKWTYDGAAWSKAGNEDRVFFMWDINGVSHWNTTGCAATCHGSFMATDNSGELADIWHWKASRSDPVGVADDKYLAYSTTNGRMGDQGRSSYIENKASGVTTPIYMHANDPDYNAGYPMYDSEVVPFDAGLAWSAGSTIPGVIVRPALGSRGDVQTRGNYDAGTWTVEFKRARNTGNGDDVQF